MGHFSHKWSDREPRLTVQPAVRSCSRRPIAACRPQGEENQFLGGDFAARICARYAGEWESACKEKPFGETRLVFLTADAGHDKTALLRQLTRQLAEAYISGRSDMVLFHIDTQGRSFVRLEEAVARDLGQLRIYGLFYQGRLVRNGLLALAIDGFDELLAEIGVGEAYSGLGALFRQLEGRGVVIASARSASFEIENYAAQTRLLTSLSDTHVTVEHMRLEPWILIDSSVR